MCALNDVEGKAPDPDWKNQRDIQVKVALGRSREERQGAGWASM